MDELINKAKTLSEALPYIREFYGKTIVIKYGGSINSHELNSFARDVVLMKYVGMNPVIVHGGGPQIGDYLSKLGLDMEFIAGLRVTTDEVMEVAQMVLVGKVGQDIISAINHLGGTAVGVSGNEGKLIMAKKLNIKKFAKENGIKIPANADVGHVGEVEAINPGLIDTLDKSGYIPVIAPIGFDEQGNSYNINADHVAGKVAGALDAEKFIILTNVAGIMSRKKELISTLHEKEAKKLIRNQVISKGMIPKVICAVNALDEGVKKVHMIDGTKEHSLLLEVFTDKGIGTEIVI
ncbi:MAG: acetylglutamate kinase [Candidatus Dadabacteria bacterium]|nr:acetylglutamate kinase [Candidatus Dadabacteria bacterium]NIS09910.1 acetylglutamate kinase [Candidatus Dadabacteria bacterium]NIV41739.1 acetylglutamate kinase [Candidatus Dadabacteria bacterium]NIX16335.1 acetylglutamate kinase [Candidatus Dadabacteria bacterium]NIY21156.1 acetylglutamate kinase [Candidatus Dadabacteria bacterium]